MPKNRIKISNDFHLDEFVDRNTYNQFQENSIWFIDKKIVDIAQFFREKIGKPVTINNWINGGKFQYSGYRPPECTEGAAKSQHRFGRAVDLKVKNKSGDQLFIEIYNHMDEFLALGLTTVENTKATPTWLHLDTRQTVLGRLLIVNP